ncbi:putative ribonuclease H-like domain-containing protein [Tanacetum coccineum]
MDLETAQTNTTAKLPFSNRNGNSFKLAAQTTTNAEGTSTTLIPGPVTSNEKIQKKNDVKARSMLLMALPNEHLLTFNQYKDAKTLFAAIQTRFGGNDATKKTQKTLLKQMYENFSAPSTESLDSIFNRLQKIVSQLAILGENISQEDLNLKFLRSLPSEWNTHVVVWRNKPDLDTMSFNDLYNNFKIIDHEVKGTTSSSSSLSFQNVAFVSSSSSTNKVNTVYGVSTANTQVSHASTQVSTASTQVSTANLIRHWLALRQKVFPEKLVGKVTINGSNTAGYDKSKVECFNYHKLGHFARECRGPTNQDNMSINQDSSKRTINMEETSSKAILAIDGASFDWSFMADEEVPTDMALMAFLDLIEFNKFEFNLATYKRGLASVEEQLVFYKKNESLDKLIGSQITDKSRKGVGFVSYNVVLPPPKVYSPPNLGLSNSGLEEFQQPKFKGYGPKTSKSVSEDTSNEVRESPNASLVKELVSNDKLEKKTIFHTVAKINFVRPQQQEKPVKPKAVNTARPNTTVVNAVRENQFNAVKASTCWVWRPTKLNSASITFKRHNYVDARGRSKHMTWNMSYLSDFKEFDGGYVTFRGGAKGGRITSKGTLKTSKLDFEDVYFVKELQLNLFSVSQMCDKKNSVLFIETGCFVLSPDFKLADESQILTCLVAKATLDESMLWHRRIGHGKQHKASCKSKIQNSITQPLFMLHMDLFGPTFVSNLMNKKYCLVVTNDYSRFTWVFFLASKDETSDILKSFTTQIENLVDKKVKIIRCDNGIEFKNRVMSEFCEKKGIKRKFSVARTPQQNGVAERRNRTLIEAARTMLADSKLPTTFWAEAVNTACYVQNRVLVVKPHNKTPYELFRGRTPSLSFMRPFGCHVTILNTLDHLGKFDGKSDDGFFLDTH